MASRRRKDETSLPPVDSTGTYTGSEFGGARTQTKASGGETNPTPRKQSHENDNNPTTPEPPTRHRLTTDNRAHNEEWLELAPVPFSARDRSPPRADTGGGASNVQFADSSDSETSQSFSPETRTSSTTDPTLEDRRDPRTLVSASPPRRHSEHSAMSRPQSSRSLRNRRSVMSHSASTEGRRRRIGSASRLGSPASQDPIVDVDGDNEDDEKQNYERREKLKGLSLSMSEKRTMLRNLTRGTNIRGMSGLAGCRFHLKRDWKRFKDRVREATIYLQVWGSSLREIEGRFGFAILAYFEFVKQMLLLNLLMFALVTVFVVVPYATVKHTAALEDTYTINDTCAYNVTVSSDWLTLIQDTIQGTGYLEKTYLFYGYYDRIVLLIVGVFDYNFPIAYLVTGCLYFIISLVILVRHSATGIRKNILNNHDKSGNVYCNKVLTGWDYNISNSNTAKLKHNIIHYDISASLKEERAEIERRNRTFCQNAGLYTLRGVINLFIVCSLCAGGYAIFMATSYSVDAIKAANLSSVMEFVWEYLPSVTITILNFVLPMTFKMLVRLEKYTPSFELQITLIRTVFLKLASVAILVISLYPSILCTNEDECSACNNITCWETYIGQNIYKLLLMNFFVGVLVTIFEFIRRRLAVCCQCGLAKMIGNIEFEISKNVLDVVYTQTLVWLGTFFAPLVPVISVLHYLIIFYLKKWSLITNCKIEARPFRMSASFFSVLQLSSLLLCTVPVAYVMFNIEPSIACGPFRGNTDMTEEITQAIAKLNTFWQSAFAFVGSLAFAVSTLIILCLVLYYYTAVAAAYRHMVVLMKEQLTLEGKDKQFLLNQLNQIQKGHRNTQTARPTNNHVISNETLATSTGGTPSQTSNGTQRWAAHAADVVGIDETNLPGSV